MVMGPPRIYPPLPWVFLSLIDVLQWVFVVYTFYTIALPLAGLWTRQLSGDTAPVSRFAIVIPAHNEGRVVGKLIESCLSLRYPRDLFDVFVVADNCDDDTAQVAEAAGALVLQRENRNARGKGFALDYAFSHILGSSEHYDAFVIFDADNLVHPDFLRVMNAHMVRGDKVIQGRMDAKNPTDTWVSATFAMSVWVSNRFWFLAKYNLGFSSVLGGTGMCVSCDLIRQIGWGAHSFTEDLEFTMKALQHGVKTTWAHNAICYDEKVQTFAASWTQRKRWVQGQATVARMYLLSMGWRGLFQASPIFLEAAFQIFSPFYLMLGSFLMVLTYLVPGQFLLDPALHHLDTSAFWVVVAGVEYTLPLIAALIDRAPLRALIYLPLYPVFLDSWIPLTWVGMFSPRPRHWTHTEHTRAVAHHELMALRGAERR